MHSQKLRRLLIVTDAWEPQVNGVVRTLQNTRRELKALGVEVEMITPLEFKTLPCPTYPEIRLSLTTASHMRRRLIGAKPDALHIATEGPLGWAASKAAKALGWRYTTAYHTRFPEYIHARFGVPLSLSYGVFRRFHQGAHAVLAPTAAVIAALNERGFSRVVHWSRGVDHEIFKPLEKAPARNPERPVFLYAGRLAVEKNIEAFLKLDLPGEKWVAGEGPLAEMLKRKYPDVRYIGVLPQAELAALYNAADVFVFPSLTDTFGLVMVEAMACGLPVAAYPVAGPIDVVGNSGAGSLREDLRAACLEALKIPRGVAMAHAAQFTWAQATRQFYDNLVPAVSPDSKLQSA
ncbi:MAG: hypothetical protein RIR70_1677 [Pseudomonadota bacterium]|jgi:glycosyltransferase involved in cell wall biosynthesis